MNQLVNKATYLLPCNDPVVGCLHKLPLLDHVHTINLLVDILQLFLLLLCVRQNCEERILCFGIDYEIPEL